MTMKTRKRRVSRRRKDNFFERVYRLVRRIPRGRVTTYGRIAAALGEPRAARTVGMALRAAGTSLDRIPAHRVVNRLGQLTGKHSFPTPTMMADLLRNEGVEVVDDCVVDFKQRLWDPTERQ